MPRNKILLVANGPDDAETTLKALRTHNIANKVVLARDGAEAMALVKKSGVNIPFIFLPGAAEEETAAPAIQGQHPLTKNNLKHWIPTIQREVRKARARRERNPEQEQIAALCEMTRALSAVEDLPNLLDTLLEKIDLLLPYDGAAVRLRGPATASFESFAASPMRSDNGKGWLQELVLPCDHRVMEKRSAVAVTRLAAELEGRASDFVKRHGWASYLGVPLMDKGDLLGVLSFYTKQEHVFTKAEIRFLSTLGSYAATAIHTAQLSAQALKHKKELEEANKVKSEFLAIMSHELRTPLTVVMGYAGIIHDELKAAGQMTAEQQEALHKILQHTTDLSDMINNILQVSRMEAGPIPLALDRIDLDAFLTDLELACPPPVDKELAMIWDCPPDLPRLQTDGTKLKQILENLIHNAVKFTPQGHVTITARDFPHSRSVEFRIADTGIGIPEESLPIIFDMFRQVDSSQARSHGGVGLGLYIVKKFTALLGGKIDVISEPNRGTIFTVTIPYETPTRPA